MYFIFLLNIYKLLCLLFYLQDIIYDSEINDIILLIIKTRGYA